MKPQNEKAEGRANDLRPVDSDPREENEAKCRMPTPAEAVKQRRARPAKPVGNFEKTFSNDLVIQIRRYVKLNGKIPRLDSDDTDLQWAWIHLCRHIERNQQHKSPDIRRTDGGAV